MKRQIPPDISESLITKQQDFYLLAQSQSSNKLDKQITKHISDPAQFDLYGNGTVFDKDFKLFIKGYMELANGVNQSAAMLLDSLMIAATQSGLRSTLITLPLKEYMNMRDLRDEKETRAQVKRDIDALERVSFEYRGIGKQRAWLRVSIAGGTVGQIKNGDIVFRFNQDFFDSYRIGSENKYLYMYFPREALRGNIRQHPHKYWIARKIAEHKRMNLGKPNEDIISVQTLIDACPHFPNYESIIKSSDRHILERIIDPFERDMDELNQSLAWHYTDMEENPRDYQTFITATVTIIWKYYPDTKELEDKKAKRSKKTASKKRTSD
jgi:hypothetical protein